MYVLFPFTKFPTETRRWGFIVSTVWPQQKQNRAWISNYVKVKYWRVIIHAFNDSVEVGARMNNFILLLCMHLITYPSLIPMLVY